MSRNKLAPTIFVEIDFNHSSTSPDASKNLIPLIGASKIEILAFRQSFDEDEN
jgi:hypothetical protein